MCAIVTLLYESKYLIFTYRWFAGHGCFTNHKCQVRKTNGKKQRIQSICERVKRCIHCGQLLKMYQDKKHQCGYFTCRICNKYTLKEGHKCFIQPLFDTPKKDPARFIFFLILKLVRMTSLVKINTAIYTNIMLIVV